MTTTSRWAIGIMCIIMAVMLLSIPITVPNDRSGLGLELTAGYFLLVVASCVRWRGRRSARRIAAAIAAIVCAVLAVFAVLGPPSQELQASSWIDRLPACLPMLL